MTKLDDLAETLDGPVGWIVVGVAALVALYLGVKAIDNGISNVNTAVSDDIKKASCWFNNACLLTCLISGGKSTQCIGKYLTCGCAARATASGCPLCGSAC